jgi:mRNA-degrading endonuclease toxin of MazEF toxin-antitoxin module
MKAWEIWTGDIYGQHPVVLVSCQPRIVAKPEVVVLKCTTMKPASARTAKENETVLDEADGLDWKTVCRCDLLFTVAKESLKNHRGTVSQARRLDIARKIIQGLAIAGL